MTSTITEADDLDLLDDEHDHAVCHVCYPKLPPLGTTYTAWCGIKAICMRHCAWPESDACPRCLKDPRCATCGTPSGRDNQ